MVMSHLKEKIFSAIIDFQNAVISAAMTGLFPDETVYHHALNFEKQPGR